MEIALVLGGGGVRGFAHIGVLKVLVEGGIRVCAIAGSSIGGLIGAAYALGKSPADIEGYARTIDQAGLFRARPGQQSGFRGVEGIRTSVDEIFGERTFEALQIPFVANAVDISTGEPVILSEGRIGDAVMAAIALPGVFEPGEWDGRTVLDGGLINSNPVMLARDLAPDVPVVAVVLSRPLPAWPRPSPLDRLIQSGMIRRLIHQTRYYRSVDQFIRAFEIVNHRLNSLQLALDDPEVIIRPQTGHIETLAQVDIQEIIHLGEAAAREKLPEIRSLEEHT